MSGTAAVWLALATAALVTYAPRALGVALAGRIDPNGLVFRWTGCVAYALLAGLVARMILLPVGPLLETGFDTRVIATAVALAAFAAGGRSLLLGAVCGTGTLVLLTATGFRLL